MLRERPRRSKARPVLKAGSNEPDSAAAQAAFAIAVLVPLTEAGAIVVLVRVLRTIPAVVTLVRRAIVFLGDGVVAVAILAVVDSVLVAVAVAACRSRFLVAARRPADHTTFGPIVARVEDAAVGLAAVVIPSLVAVVAANLAEAVAVPVCIAVAEIDIIIAPIVIPDRR